MLPVVRSKGFIWLSSQHDQSFYWAHAGKHFQMLQQGPWWAAVPQADWPAEGTAAHAAAREDFDGAFGDRRQELVFIGVAMDEAAVVAALDSALLDDAEWAAFQAKHGVAKAE